METASIAIRPARRDDFASLWSVATLDSATVPPEPLLVAEADGEIVAALSLPSGETIADPFRRTAAAVDLLRLRARQFEAGAGGGWRWAVGRGQLAIGNWQRPRPRRWLSWIAG